MPLTYDEREVKQMSSIAEQDVLILTIKRLLEINYNAELCSYSHTDATSVIFTIKHNELNIIFNCDIPVCRLTIDALSTIYGEICKELEQECIKLLKR